MKRCFSWLLVAACFVLGSCSNGLVELPVESTPKPASADNGTVKDEADPVGGLTVVVKSEKLASNESRAITGVTKMAINLESATYPSIAVIATESNGTFTARIPSIKAGVWTVKASLFDASDVEKYYGTADTEILWNVANKVTLSVAATGKVDVDVIEDTTGYRVSAPQISPNVSIMMESFYASLSTPTPGAVIRYTLDGTEPTPTHGFLYGSSILVDKNKTIKAIAVKDGFKVSSVTTKTYELKGPELFTTIPAGPYTDTITVTNDHFYLDSQHPASINDSGFFLTFTTDGTDPTFDNGERTAPTGILPPGTVLKAAVVKKGWTTNNIVTITATYNLTMPQIASTVPAGPYTTVLNVAGLIDFVPGTTKSLGENGFALRYTIDGTDPTYENGLTSLPVLDKSCTLKIAAVKQYYTPSNVITIDVKYSFTITLDPNGRIGSMPTVGTINTSLPSKFILPTNAIVDSWCTTADGTGTKYAPGATVNAPNGSITLYAIYQSYAIGDTGPGGGRVFYKKSSKTDGWQYLEYAANNLGECKWIENTVSLTNNSSAVGDGWKNCEDIYAALSSTNKNSGGAFKLCRDYVSNGYDDWYLPSKGELDALFTAIATLSNNGGVATQWYWTSTASNNCVYNKKLAQNWFCEAVSTTGVYALPIRRF